MLIFYDSQFQETSEVEEEPEVEKVFSKDKGKSVAFREEEEDNENNSDSQQEEADSEGEILSILAHVNKIIQSIILDNFY